MSTSGDTTIETPVKVVSGGAGIGTDGIKSWCSAVRLDSPNVFEKNEPIMGNIVCRRETMVSSCDRAPITSWVSGWCTAFIVCSTVLYLQITFMCVLIHQCRTQKSRSKWVRLISNRRFFMTSVRCISDHVDLRFLSESLLYKRDRHNWSVFHELGWFGNDFSSDSRVCLSSEVTWL